MFSIGTLALVGSLAVMAETVPVVSPQVSYHGMCDASAGVAVGKGLFAVGNDEDNTLRVYRAGTGTGTEGGSPVTSTDLSTFLRVETKFPESDLEGAAWLGRHVFWITSHGRNREGKYRESRHRFFATTVEETGDTVRLAPTGVPYRRLLRDLTHDGRFAQFHLSEASKLPPKHPAALNIEGLCATPEGSLLIGFRNPIPFGRALLVPLLNPEHVILGLPAQLGSPILLNLGGQGIRDLGYWSGKYVIVAGSADAEGVSRLFLWEGLGKEPSLLAGVDFRDFNPEALVIYPENTRAFQVLSDDGTKLFGDVECKKLTNPKDRRFRSVWVTPP
jgi:hypothetical protein